MEQLHMFGRPMTAKKLFWFPGSKSQATPTILKHIIGKTDEMISPFIGSGALELALAANGIRVHGYDISPRLALIWKYIIKDGERLACFCQDKLNTLKHEELVEIFRFNVEITDDPFEKAGYFYLWQALAFRGILIKSGHLCNYTIKEDGEAYYVATDTLRRLTFFKEMAEFYNPNLSVGEGDFEETLGKHPDLFAYLDPPYPVIKGVNTLYNMEKTEKFDHERMARVLKARNTGWLLSYNNTQIIRDLYPKTQFNWHFQEWHQGNSVSKKATNEVLISPKD